MSNIASYKDEGEGHRELPVARQANRQSGSLGGVGKVIRDMSRISKGIFVKCMDAREEEQDSTEKSVLEVERKLAGDSDDSTDFVVDLPLRRAEVVVDEVPPPPPEGQSIQNSGKAKTLGPPGLLNLQRGAEGRAYGGQ